MPGSSPANHAPPQEPGETRYVLLTECLQNDFLLNRECRLYVSDKAALGMLVGRTAEVPPPGGGRLEVSAEDIERGPLGVFLEAVIDRRRRRTDGHGTLHVINIRDWHEPGAAYDRERRTYGNHCEKGTWGAEYVNGLKGLLDPAGQATDQEAVSFVEGSVRVCHVHADSVFDFRPRTSDRRGPLGKLPVTELEDILDVLVQGSDEEVAAVDGILAGGAQLDSIHEVAKKVETQPEPSVRVYVAVIGVYSDIKVLTLLGGLLARYDLANLAVSDTLTSSPTLERHISGLDFASKVMQVEVVHGVNDLVRYVGGTPPLESESELVAAGGFAHYQTFFKDKQSVLAYQSEKLQDYLVLTERRAINTYNWIERSNLFLIGWGSVFLVATLVFAIWSAVDPSEVSWAIPAITGGLGLAQLATAFFTQPMKDLQRNLMNLTTYRMVLESHSLKMALARFHLTTPHTLKEIQTETDSEVATRQVLLLERELEAVRQADEVDYGALKSLRIGPEEQIGGVIEDETAAVDGRVPKETPEQASVSPTDDARIDRTRSGASSSG